MHYLEAEFRDLVKRDESIFRFLEKSSLDGLWYWDLSDRETEWMSPEFWRLFGCNPAKMPDAPKAWHQIVHPDDLAAAMENLERHLDDPYFPYDQILRCTHQITGREITVRSRGMAIRDSKGVPLRMLGAHTDLTAIKETEAKLAASNAKLRDILATTQQDSSAKTDFLQTLSHEMRTPMNGILGMSEALLQSELTEKQTELVRVVNRSSRIMLDMMNDILELSRIESGEMESSRAPFSPRSVIADVIELFRPLAEERGLALGSNVSDTLPDQVSGSQRALRQVLVNLMSNALKFTDEGSVTIVASLENDDNLVVDIVDTGPGIDPKDQEIVFENFLRGSAQRFGAVQGAGLGLSIARGLCQLHHGQLNLRDTPEGGATFTASFKIDKVETEQAPSSVENGHSQGRPMHILVAEDNEINCLVVESMLEKCNATCDIAADGQEALEMAQANHYDGGLIDIRMPVLDGVEFIRKRRKFEAERGIEPMRLVAYSANVLEHQISEYLTRGFDRHLAKPSTFEEFRECIDWLTP